jgi:preprotein translocase SecE subunit
MKKVTWPPVPETHRLTGVVLAVCTMLILLLWVFTIVSHTLVQLITGN